MNEPIAVVQSERRDFLKQTAAGVAALSVAASAHGAGADESIRIGLIGCGGRGTGAATQALEAGDDVKLVALGDVFEDHLKESRELLASKYPERGTVADERCHTGFDAFRQVCDSDVDVVLLATPPHFRPEHLEYAVEKGKHVFCEKPVAVDPVGLRRAWDASRSAQEKGLSLVSGLCYRYFDPDRELYGRVQDGAIGDVVALQANYNTGGLWTKPRQESWSDMEWQLRNWLYFTWLSGDHNVEQHIHSLDKALWAMGDASPVSAVGLGGRQSRTDRAYGMIFDHHAVVYEFAGGTRLYSYCRQQQGAYGDDSDWVFGTKGKAVSRQTRLQKIEGESPWEFRKKRGDTFNMYQKEHDVLFDSIRKGEPVHNGDYMCNSTMVAIMGRMATYTGQLVKWDEALNSDLELSPEKYEMGPLPVRAVAKPGITTLT